MGLSALSSVIFLGFLYWLYRELIICTAVTLFLLPPAAILACGFAYYHHGGELPRPWRIFALSVFWFTVILGLLLATLSDWLRVSGVQLDTYARAAWDSVDHINSFVGFSLTYLAAVCAVLLLGPPHTGGRADPVAPCSPPTSLPPFRPLPSPAASRF